MPAIATKWAAVDKPDQREAPPPFR